MGTFEAVDSVWNQTMFTGETDGTNITKIEPVGALAGGMLDRTQARIGVIDTLDKLLRVFPRLSIGLHDIDDDVEKQDTTDLTEAEVGIVKTDKKKQQIFGWAYVTHDKHGNVVVDKSGEFVEDVQVLEKAAYDYVLTSRKGGSDHLRNRFGDKDEVIVRSRMIESIVFTPEKIAKMGIPEGTIPQGAWWVGFQVDDADTWRRIERGELKAFSIHGSGIKSKVA